MDTVLEGSRVLRLSLGDAGTQWIADDPAAPLRLIVEFDVEPLAKRAPGGMRAVAEATARFESDLSRLAARSQTGAQAPHFLRRYSRVFAGAAVVVPPALEAGIRALPYVRSVTLDRKVSANLEQTVPLIGADRVATQLGGTGTGVRVGIVDTGVDYTHAALGGAFGAGARVAGGWDFVNGDGDPRDDNGHGTHVAGIVGANGGGIRGVAPDVTLYAYKVLNEQGSGYESDVIAALERCADPDQDPDTDDALDVVNLSLGSSFGQPDDPMARAVDALSEAGTLCAVAAGNDYAVMTIGSPGTARSAITVGASDKNDNLAVFTSGGPVRGSFDLKPDLVAPGVDVASAEMGGGAVALSGTSMATPHVAGAAALVLQLHPSWSQDRVRSALVGTAHGLGADTFMQGAGRLDAFAACTSRLFTSPTHLSFGRLDPTAAEWTRAETLWVTADAAGPGAGVRLMIERPGVPAAVQLSIAPDTLTLLSGETHFAILTLRVSPAALADPQSAPFGFAGTVSVRDAGVETLRVPFSIHECASVRAQLPSFGGYALVHDRSSFGRGLSSLNQFTEFLPAGRYDVVALIDWNRTVIREDVDVSGDVVVPINASEATATITFADETGMPHPGDRGDVEVVCVGASVGMGLVSGFHLRDYHISPASSRYRLEWTIRPAEITGTQYAYPGAASGPFSNRTFLHFPSQLRRLVYRVPATPEARTIPVALNWYPGRWGDNFYFGFGVVDTTQLLDQAPAEFELWYAPPPNPNHIFYGRSIELWAKGPGRWWPPGRPVFLGPTIKFDEPGGLGVYPATFFQPRSMLLEGEKLGAGVGPPIFRGRFQNAQQTIVIAPSIGFGGRLFTDEPGSWLEESPSHFERIVGGVVVESDTLAGEGSLSTFSPNLLQLGAGGPHEVRVFREGGSVGGVPARTDVWASFDTNHYENNPPYLTALQVLASGSVADSIDFSSARSPHVQFELFDDNALQSVALAYFDRQVVAWTELPVERNGSTFESPLPRTLDGPVSLRLVAVDVAGNVLRIEMTPAFIARPALRADVVFAEADAQSDRVRLTWRVSAAAGTVLGVERRVSGGVWAEIGVAQVDGGGVLTFEDTSVRPDRNYAYRLATASDARGETWVYVPLGVALSLRVSPNPAREHLVVSFELPDAAPSTLEVFDVTGRRIEARELTGLAPGAHVVNLTLETPRRAGVLFVRLKHGASVLHQRVALIR